ncbi:hypothetical protein KA005_31995 [bacterium]|nr:hypothetical protein [bacterium]
MTNQRLEEDYWLAKAAGLEANEVGNDCRYVLYKDAQGYPAKFNRHAPDTLQRLRFELKISVVWNNHYTEWMVVRRDGHKSIKSLYCTTQQEIDKATIECALVILAGEKE